MAKGLSRMRGNSHVRFLGGWCVVTFTSYPVAHRGRCYAFSEEGILTRGYFNQTDMGPAYTESSKNWHITLDRSNCFWYELIVNPPAFVDTRRDITDYLR